MRAMRLIIRCSLDKIRMTVSDANHTAEPEVLHLYEVFHVSGTSTVWDFPLVPSFDYATH